MTVCPEWWSKPRNVTVVVDNPSWILPYAEKLIEIIRNQGDNPVLARTHAEVADGGVAFFLGCIKIAPSALLSRNHRNLVVHASDLPKGRGFSPLTWQILEGKSRVPVCLLEAEDSVDSGPVIYREWIDYGGHELIEELRAPLGEMTVDLCRRFLTESFPPIGECQTGEPTIYPRRRPLDSCLAVEKSIADQFDLLRVVDNDAYPAWFEYRGHRYRIKIEKTSEKAETA